MTNTNLSDRRAGALFGLAYGDAIGDPVEFRKYEDIMASGGVRVPEQLRITDDTQMSLAVWNSLLIWRDNPAANIGMLRSELIIDFTGWYTDPDNNRAPGNACLSACGKLSRWGFARWQEATGRSSAGCGSVMRAGWIGAFPGLTSNEIRDTAMVQAVLTHAPAENAYAAAALAELVAAIIAGEVVPGSASDFLFGWADAAAGSIYDERIFGNLWRIATDSDRNAYGSPDDYVADGVAHVRWIAQAAQQLAGELKAARFWGIDPCEVAGQGWRARQTVALAVGIFDALDTVAEALEGNLSAIAEAALLRAAQTNGDSDSIGAITGCLVGAFLGFDAFPSYLEGRLEERYRNELHEALNQASVYA
jgi:ADP-ribosylglycohydrolase